jgi:hypothetical protein
MPRSSDVHLAADGDIHGALDALAQRGLNAFLDRYARRNPCLPFFHTGGKRGQQ